MQTNKSLAAVDPFITGVDHCSPILSLQVIGEVMAGPQFPMWAPAEWGGVKHHRGGLTDDMADGNWDRLFVEAAAAFQRDIAAVMEAL